MHVVMAADFPLPDAKYGTRPQPTPVLRLVEGLAETHAGPEVTVVTFHDGRTRQVHELANGTRVVALPRLRYTGGAMLNVPRVGQLLHEFARLRPDIIHAQGAEGAFAQAAVLSRYPHVVTVHGIMRDVLPVTRPPRVSLARVPGIIERFVFSRMQNAIAISPYTQQRLKDLRQVRWFHVPNAVSEDFFTVEALPRDRQFVSAGTLYPLKGMHVLADAVAILNRAGVTGRVVIFGGAFSETGQRYRDDILRRAGNGTSFVLEIQPWATPSMLAQTMASSKAAIVASAVENMSMVLTEALATGTPVIATRVGGSPDVIDGENGILVDYGDADSLSRAMLRVMDSADWQKMSRRSRAAAEQFRVPAVAACTLDAYKDILQESS